MTTGKQAHIIVVGNEKGGSGKTTTSMHITMALLYEGHTVGSIDLDVRQRSFTRYLENRLAWMHRREHRLRMPRYSKVVKSEADMVAAAASDDTDAVNVAIDRLLDNDFIVIDTPGADTVLSRAAHMRADTVVTPLNDSFVDFDLLAHVDPDSLEILAPSLYADMLWEARKLRAMRGGKPIDWIVMRNRMSHLNAKNKERMGMLIDKLAERFRFRVAPGFTERVIYRELFLSGLTLLDLSDRESGVELNMSHVAARQEVRQLLACLNLPAPQGGTAGAAG